MFPNPKLLTHPQIPKPLHGTNPRSLLGKQWWDIQRAKAYIKHKDHCWACGVPKIEAPYHKWLEGHESYDINYKTGKVKLNEIVALCHSCHNFIHSGRLSILENQGKVSKDKLIQVLLHGWKLLEAANLKPFWATANVYNDRVNTLGKRYLKKLQVEQNPGEVQQNWSKWHIEIKGKNYYGLFKCYEDWENYYP